MAPYAIVRTGGKQYRVEEGASIDVERLPVPEGDRVELKDVLLLSDGASVTVGSPTVPDARVVAEVVAHGRAPKITVYRYKAKTRYRRKTGHRQAFTRLAIQRIQVGAEVPEEKRPARRRARAAAAEAEPAPEAVAPARRRQAAPKPPAAEAVQQPAAPPKRKRATPRAKAQAEAAREPTTATKRRRAAPKTEQDADKKTESPPARRTRRKSETEKGE